MSFFPVPVIHPRPYTRHVLEMWEYQWHAGRQTYERICFRPIQIAESEGNPTENIEGYELFPAQNIRVEDMDLEVQRLMNRAPYREESQRRVPPPRPPPPNFGMRAVAALTGADRDNAIVLDSPASPDPSPSTSPVDTPTKRQEPSPPPVSPSRVKCQSPVYIALQDHDYQLPECTNNDPYDDPSLGMSADVWPRTNQPESQRRPSP